MSKVVTPAELQKNAQAVLDWARAQTEPVIVETLGQPSLVILRLDEYQAYLRYREAQQERSERFRRLREFAGQNAARSGLTEAEAAALVEEAREEVYRLGLGSSGQ